MGFFKSDEFDESEIELKYFPRKNIVIDMNKEINLNKKFKKIMKELKK